jgi:hypothetical protein
MASIVDELLRAWRDGERLPQRLPASDPDWPDVAETVAMLRVHDRRLTDAQNRTGAKLDASDRTIESALFVIDRAPDPIGQSPLAAEEP